MLCKVKMCIFRQKGHTINLGSTSLFPTCGSMCSIFQKFYAFVTHSTKEKL